MQPIEPLMQWAVGAHYPCWKEVLRDQTEVLIRPITKEDGAAEKAFIAALSPAARHFRFLGAVGRTSDEMIEKLTNVDYVHELAFVAVASDNPATAFAGVARYSTNLDGTDCECVVTVLDEWFGRGLGTVLLTHLIEVAKARGIKHMWSMDSAANTAMADVAKYVGFDRRQDPDDASQVIHSLWL